MPSLHETIKQISLSAIREGAPTSVRFGVVKEEKPLKIEVEQKLLLEEEAGHLILTHSVKDYEVDISVSHITEVRGGGGGYTAYESHDHTYSGRKKIKVHNALKLDEKVILLQLQGGQQFIVLDRIDAPRTEGEWL